MAEDIVYDQVETGDPDPLGLRKRAATKQAKPDPLGLRQKSAPVQRSQPQQAFQVQISEPSFGAQSPSELSMAGTVVSDSGIKGAKEFSFDKPYDPLAVEKLKGKATEAQSKLHAELQGNDKQYEKNLRAIRRDSYNIDNLRRDYKEQGLILSPQDEDRILKIEKQKRYDAPITVEDISDIKTGTILDNTNARKFIKDIDKPEVKKNAFLVDKYNEIANDPNGNHRVEKIKNVAKLIEKGDVIYDPEKKVAIQPLGLLGSAIEGVKNKFKLEEEHDFLKDASDATIINQLEGERNNPDTDEPIKVPKGKAQEFLMSLAEMPISPMIAGVAGTIGGTFIGNPEIGAIGAGALGAYENRKANFTQTFKQVYNEVRDQGGSEYDAINKARQQANTAQEIGTIVGAAQGLIGAKIASSSLKFSPAYQQSVGQMLKQNGSEFGKILLEGAAQGGIGSIGEIAKNKLAQTIGINRDIRSGTSEQFWNNLLLAGGIGAAMKLGRGMTRANYKTILHGLSQVPEETINSAIQEKVANGDVTQEAANQTIQNINEYKGLDKLIPENISEEARFKIQDKILKRNELESQIENTDKAYHPAIKEKIKAIDEEILGLSKETESPTKTESGLSKSKEKEAIETAEEFLAEGVLPSLYSGMIKQDPVGFWKMIAQQAQNRDENWRPLTQELNEQAIRDQFGDTVVEYAKELFPAPAIEESGISVIQPGEIKRPETITIAPREQPNEVKSTERVSVIMPNERRGGKTSTIKSVEDAIPERSAETPIVDETSGGSEEVVGGIPESGQTPIPQERQPTSEEATGASEEGQKVGIHVEQPPTQLSFRGLQEVANEFGYEDVKSRDRVSDIQERKNAEVTANEWAQKGEYQKNIDDMLGKIERKEMVPTAKQRLILEQYLANERQKARSIDKFSPEYDKQLNRIKYIKDVGEIARQEAGAALRLPNEGTLPHPIVDEESAMIAKMEANAVDELTQKQKEEVIQQVEKYKQADEQAKAKIAELEAMVAKIDAKKEINKIKSTTSKTKKSTEERIAYRKSEIQAARDALKKLRSGESGLSAVPLPGLRELVAIAPHVKNIMKDLVEQGIDNLGDLVKQLHTEFKDVVDGLTEKNVHDIIAGEYNDKKQPLSELQKTVQDLKYEAKLINQLEALERGMPPKNERLLRERNRRIKELRDQIKEKTKEYEQEFPDYEKRLKAIKTRNESRIKEIENKIKNKDFEKTEKPTSVFDRDDVKKQFPKLRDEALNAVAKKEDIQHEYDLALFKDEKSRWTKLQHAGDIASKVIHTSKSFVAGIDDSATFVQNGLAMLANPQIGAKVFLQHWKEAFSDPKFKRELAALHNSNDYPIMKASGLDIIEQVSDTAQKVSEEFEKNLLAGKFKVNGKEYHPWKYTGGIFERAFASMGNNMRVELFRRRMAQLLADEKTFDTHPQEYKDAARVINELTARGKQNKYIEQASPIITPVLWAPRMLSSTFNLLGLSDAVSLVGGKRFGTEGYYRKLTPAQRKFALAQVGRGVGMGVAIMGAAALGGAKVDWDPYSVTFGDIIVGPHHYNVFGRFMPVVKTLIQAASGRRDTKGGQQDLDNPAYNGKTRLGVVEGFFRGKVTPAVGTTLNLIAGEDYFSHQKFGLKDVPGSLLVPMSVKDLLDGWKNDGTWGLLNRFLPAFEGIKATDERDFQKTSSTASSSGKPHKQGKPTKHTKNTKK